MTISSLTQGAQFPQANMIRFGKKEAEAKQAAPASQSNDTLDISQKSPGKKSSLIAGLAAALAILGGASAVIPAAKAQIAAPGHCENYASSSPQQSIGHAQSAIDVVQLRRNGEVATAGDNRLMGSVTTLGIAYNHCNEFRGYAERALRSMMGEDREVTMIYNVFNQQVGFVTDNGDVYRLHRNNDGYRQIGTLHLGANVSSVMSGAYALLAFERELNAKDGN